jgi:hypothetical protein
MSSPMPQGPKKPVEKYLAQAILWIRENQERFWAVTGGAFLSVLFVALVVHRNQTQSEDAWTQLGPIQSQLMQGNMNAGRTGLADWEKRFLNTDAGTYAKFVKADLLYRTSDYVQASQVYADLVQRGRPELVKPMALSAEVACEEMAGHLPQAQALAQIFLDRYPDHFMAAPMYISQARLAELSGNNAAAAAIYDRFVLLYPQSPWTQLAKTRSQNLPKK